MKIVIIGESVYGGWAQTFKDAFEKMGHNVVIIDDWKIYRSSSPLARNRYVHRLFWWALAPFVQGQFAEAVVREQPDLILAFKAWLWMPITWRKIKRQLRGVVIANYNPDSPWNREAHGNANRWVRNSIPIFDLYFIWSKELTEKLKKAGARRAMYLPCGYDPALHYPVVVAPEDKKLWGSDVVFVGSWDKEREGWVRSILSTKIAVWGNSWEKAAADVRAAWKGRAAVGEDFARVSSASGIVLNFLRPQNKSSHNMKTFEIPAVKGFMLAERSPEQTGFFEEDKEAAYFSSTEELKQKIIYYMDHAEKRRAIAEAGYQKLVSGKNTYSDRAETVIEAYRQVALQDVPAMRP